jgi:ABC-type multidrug transport system ATPase subunit
MNEPRKESRPGTKRFAIDQYIAAINAYCVEVMPALQKLREEGIITYGQYLNSDIYNCRYYYWLYGGKQLFADKKEPCRLYGWAMEDTALHTFRFYLDQFNEWAARSKARVDAIIEGRAGARPMSALIDELPREAVVLISTYLVDSGKEIDQLTMDEVVTEVRWAIKKSEMDMEDDHSEETVTAATNTVNACNRWLKNYAQ